VLFTEPIFFAFFAVVFTIYWALNWNQPRKILLLVASYVFYAAWDWRFLSLILISTVIDYVTGLRLRVLTASGRRKAWLCLSLCANLGILGVFKYFNFFVHSAEGLLRAAGIEVSPTAVSIVLPVGISFYTFQSMSYTIDAYRGRLEPIKNPLDFALYVAFFPQLVAGPIVRAADFLPQLQSPRPLKQVPFKLAGALFLAGFIKKACIADNLAPVVDQVYAAPETFTALSICTAAIFYAVQIYCDFSGYSDMAIAIALLLGYDLGLNFRFPYFAANIQDFWRRWHISLSSWLRDYLYISLGGGRGTTNTVLRNIMLTMLLGGLWHGASWNFVVWGGLHGLALCIHRQYAERVPETHPLRRTLHALGVPLTFYWVAGVFIFFRATTFEDAFVAVKAWTLFQSPGVEALSPHLLWYCIPLALAHAVGLRTPVEQRVRALPNWLCAVLYGLAGFLALMFLPTGYRPFIYFQF
jgi:alginate O-acetyltransferase complex protein AlgI